ncbi:MAG: hypothetical protein ACD_63C00232G0001 [uncultured bacterium]|nr:MAG: hypothetical protein ACD_63C00232G0001 [uncultured bacterium]
MNRYDKLFFEKKRNVKMTKVDKVNFCFFYNFRKQKLLPHRIPLRISKHLRKIFTLNLEQIKVVLSQKHNIFIFSVDFLKPVYKLFRVAAYSRSLRTQKTRVYGYPHNYLTNLCELPANFRG